MDAKSGQGVQVMKIISEDSYQLNEAALEQILLQDDIKELPVVVVSVAGIYRGGKSFLLDFFLRYLVSKNENKRNDKWLGAEDEPLAGFRWRNGCHRDTTGIYMWSTPIRATMPSGETVAVVLMDTQGTFDSHTTMRDSSTIFALSTLISSLQIYNISQNINEDHLQHLQLFTEYGRMVSTNGGNEKPFQTLLFLIRDWSHSCDYPYGACGGMQLLNKRLECNSNQPKELQEIRKHIHSCFNDVCCFLMPHPGFTVFHPKFDGRLADIRQEFKDGLLELVPSIFAPENLKLKLFDGQPLKCRDLVSYFKMYMKEFNSDKLPTAHTIMQATAKASMLSAAVEARQMFQDVMEGKCDVKPKDQSSFSLRDLHRAAKDAALEVFAAKKKMDPKREIDSHIKELTKEFDQKLSGYLLLNKTTFEQAITRAIRVYDEIISNVVGKNKICLHLRDLDDLHKNGLTAAVLEFDSISSDCLPDGEHNEKNNLLKRLETSLENMLKLNEANNNMSFIEAYLRYRNEMGFHGNSNIEMTQAQLEELHDRSKDKALEISSHLTPMTSIWIYLKRQ